MKKVLAALVLFLYPALNASGQDTVLKETAAQNAALPSTTQNPARLKNFAGLKEKFKEGRDYTIEVTDRKAAVTYLAIHGGIEPSSYPLAKRCAASTWNFYGFNAKVSTREIHLTSAFYDEPRAVALVQKSAFAIAFHEQGDKGDSICLGGANLLLKREIAQKLAQNGYNVEMPCKRLPGTAPTNIVNRAQTHGVQLEISQGLSKILLNSEEEQQKLCDIINGVFNPKP